MLTSWKKPKKGPSPSGQGIRTDLPWSRKDLVFPYLCLRVWILRNELENFWREEHRKAGYHEIKTPIVLNRELWERSGHWDHYQENMDFT